MQGPLAAAMASRLYLVLFSILFGLTPVIFLATNTQRSAISLVYHIAALKPGKKAKLALFIILSGA